MMGRRYMHAELHNHSTESDGQLSIRELVSYMEQEHVDVMALTDHNTVSGQKEAQQCACNKHVRVLGGVELTTMYGHVLCPGLERMVDWTDLDPLFPEPFFDRLRAAGARAVGIAHPFCMGAPVMVGCRFGMRIHDFAKVDYIEVFNTSGGDAFSGNEKALAWWTKLVLEGFPVAATTGIDLHRLPVGTDVFTTFVPAYAGMGAVDCAVAAIQTCDTVVSRGPLLEWEAVDGGLLVSVSSVSEHPYASKHWKNEEPLLVGVEESCGAVSNYVLAGDGPVFVPVHAESLAVVLKAYQGDCSFENLLCVAPPYRREVEG